MRALTLSKTLCGTLSLAFAIAAGTTACQPGTTTTTTSNTATATNANPEASNANSTSATNTSGVTIETREPEQYRATLVLSAMAEGKPQGIQLPIEVERSGDNRRYTFNSLPLIGQVIFLDRADKRYLILPGRKQYAEITPQLIGFDVRSLTPGQMVAHLQMLRGVERVGEEQRDGRTVTKYRYAATAKTASSAGDVSTESFIYVDKDTGLPLHAEMAGRSSGNMQGVSRAHLVADMKDIQTTVNAADLELPEGLTKLTDEQIKQQVAGIGQALQFVMQALSAQGGMSFGGGNNTSTAPSSSTTSGTTTTATPAATATSPAQTATPQR